MNIISKELQDKYLEILNRFTSDDAIRDWMVKIIHQDDKFMSTNGTALVAVPEIINLKFDRCDRPKKANVYPVVRTMDKIIPLDKLKYIYESIPMIDEYDEEEKECEVCDVNGEVDWTFYYGRRLYEMEMDCPVCYGKGFIKTQSETPTSQIKDYNKFIKIGINHFNSNRIEELIYVAEKLGNEIHLVSEITHNRSLFAIGEVELLLAKVLNENEGNVIEKL